MQAPRRDRLDESDIRRARLEERRRRRAREPLEVADEVRLVVVARLDRSAGERGRGRRELERALEAPERREALRAQTDAREEPPLELPFAEVERTCDVCDARVVFARREEAYGFRDEGITCERELEQEALDDRDPRHVVRAFTQVRLEPTNTGGGEERVERDAALRELGAGNAEASGPFRGEAHEDGVRSTYVGVGTPRRLDARHPCHREVGVSASYTSRELDTEDGARAREDVDGAFCHIDDVDRGDAPPECFAWLKARHRDPSSNSMVIVDLVPWVGVKRGMLSAMPQPAGREVHMRAIDAESMRLAALGRYEIIDTAPETAFDEIAHLAALICGAPLALISFVERDRQWMKSVFGFEHATRETRREHSFCSHAIAHGSVFVVPDAQADARFVSNPLVLSAPFARFYAGAPIETSERHRIGTIGVLDVVPRELDAKALEALEVLARQVLAQLEKRRVEATTARESPLIRVERLERAQRLAQLGSWDFDVATGRARWSDEMHHILGVPPDGFDGSPEAFHLRVHPDDRALVSEARARTFEIGGRFDVEHRIVRPDGAIRIVHALGEVLCDAQGAPLRATGTILDITDRKRNEHLLEREARVLAFISSGAPLAHVLREVIECIEAMLPGACAAIMTADADGAYLALAIAPNLPADVRAMLHTVPIGPDSRPCGIAAHRGTPVIVVDLVNDARHEDERVSARVHGYVSSWSLPVHDGSGRPLATVRLCFRDARQPAFEEYDLLARLLHTLGIAIERDRKDRALEASEARVRRTFEYAGTGIALASPSGQLLEVNRALSAMLGYTEHELLHTTIAAITHPDDREESREITKQIDTGVREGAIFEKRYIHKAGHAVFTRVSVSAIRDAQGAATRLVAVIEDITDRKRAEAHLEANQSALAASEKRFRLLSIVTNDAVWDWDAKTDLLVWNEGFETLFGYRRADVSPTLSSWRDFVHPDDHARVMSGLARALAGTTTQWSDTYRFVHANGSHVHVVDRGHIERDANGGVVRMFGGMTDITSRVRAEERLREQATLLDKARDAIIVRDLEDQVLYWNGSAERLYGFTASEVVGRVISTFIYRDPSEFALATSLTLTKGEWAGELEQVTKSGRAITVEARWTLVHDERGRPSSILAINTDITERKSLEAQFLRAQRMESLGTLAGGVAHDLNNLLVPIMITTSAMIEEETDARRMADLAMIELAAKRGADVVRQLLSFARGEGGRRAHVDLGVIATEVRNFVTETFPKSVTMSVEVEPSLWRVLADPTQMHQIVTNLCVNARDAMANGGTLAITVRNAVIDEVFAGMHLDAHPGAYVALEVVDTGTGMPAHVVERIFEPFFTTKEVGKGTGLGLSTVHTIVLNHGGFVRVYSEVARGTRFEIHLPAVDGSGARIEPEEDASYMPRGHGELILVVDDEAAIRDVAERTLERFGYRVLLAQHGAEAVALYAQQRDAIALVLTDMTMPVMDGHATIVALRAMNPDVRIIGSSGLDTNASVAKAIGASVDAFVAKPYTATALLRGIRGTLDGKR